MRRHAGKDPDFSDALEGRRRVVRAQLVELLAGQHLPRSVGDAEFTRDGEGRRRVVAGDHDDPDTGTQRLRDGLLHLRSQRVDEAGETQERESLRCPSVSTKSPSTAGRDPVAKASTR